jgi:hypothetical protein
MRKPRREITNAQKCILTLSAISLTLVWLAASLAADPLSQSPCNLPAGWCPSLQRLSLAR